MTARTLFQSPEYAWDSVQRGYILSVFAIGNFCTFVCSSVVVKLGGATTFGLVTLLNAIVSLLTPTLLRAHVSLFLVGRALQGLFLVGTVSVEVKPEFHSTTHEPDRIAGCRHRRSDRYVCALVTPRATSTIDVLLLHGLVQRYRPKLSAVWSGGASFRLACDILHCR